MARPSPDPETRALAIVLAARSVFASKGYRRAQMSDIAAQMGLASGTLYNAVSSKETLFETVLLHSFGLVEDLAAHLQRPPGNLIEAINTSIAEVELFPEMAAALARPLPADPTAFAALLFRLIEEHYDFMAAFGEGVSILERSALDLPDLASVYYGFLRARVISRWEDLLSQAGSLGHLPRPEEASIAARSMIELISWWTRHAPNDPAADYGPRQRRREVVRFAFHGILSPSAQDTHVN